MTNAISEKMAAHLAQLKAEHAAAVAADPTSYDALRLPGKIRGLERDIAAVSVDAMTCQTPEDYERAKRAFLDASGKRAACQPPYFNIIKVQPDHGYTRIVQECKRNRHLGTH
jgi:hypothetical protein